MGNDMEVFAQTVGLDPTAWFSQIAQTGLMGLLFCLVVYALIKRDKDLSVERAARLADALGMRSMIEADTAARVAAIKLSEEHNRLVETLARNQEALVNTATHLNDVRTLRDDEQSARILQAIAELNATLKAGGWRMSGGAQ